MGFSGARLHGCTRVALGMGVASSARIVALAWSACYFLAYLGQFAHSVLLLLLAAVFDGLDGHVARLLHELDSLCDLVDFGVAPALVVYIWLDKEGPKDEITLDPYIWLSSLFFVCCCAFRLARFNLTDIHAPKVLVEASKKTQSADGDGEDSDGTSIAGLVPAKPYSLRQRIGRGVAKKVSQTRASKKGMEIIRRYVNRKKFFRGVPAPMGGSMALSPMILSFVFPTSEWGIDPRLATAATLFLVGLLMVSTMPTLSSKMLMKNPSTESHLKSRNTYSFLFKLALVSCGLYVAAHFRWHVYLAGVVIYVFALPLGSVIYQVCEA